MKRFFAALAFSSLLSTSAFAAGWTVEPAPSDTPDLPAATATSAEGHKLYLWSKHLDERYQIFAELHLAEGGEFLGKMPTYRIDGGQTVDTDLTRQEGDQRHALWGYVSRKVAFWLVWSSDKAVVQPDEPLGRWINGKTLTVTYKASNGTVQTARFALEGSAAAIESATGVAAE